MEKVYLKKGCDLDRETLPFFVHARYEKDSELVFDECFRFSTLENTLLFYDILRASMPNYVDIGDNTFIRERAAIF